MPIPLEFNIDVSGSPGETQSYGLVSFNLINKHEIIENFFQEFPEVNYTKGHQLDRHRIQEMIEYLNERNVRMVVVIFPKNKWSYFSRILGNQHEFLEKIAGILFYTLMYPVIRKDSRYSVSTCIENQLGKIERVMHHCNRIMNTRRVELDFVFSRGTYNRGVKIADIIAYSGHVLKEKNVKGIKNYYRIKRDIPDWQIRRIFSKK